MAKYRAGGDRASALTAPAPPPAGLKARAAPGFVTGAATLGAIAAGVALFEAALIPGMVIGGAAVLVPRYLPKLRRHLRPLFGSTTRPRTEPGVSSSVQPDAKTPPPAAPRRFAIKQAVAKTITFRIIVTTLDFSTNYVVIGEFATAAGLSAFALVAGPVFYLAHETGWNYFGPPVSNTAGRWGTAIELPRLLSSRPDAKTPPAGRRGFTISRPLAKTVTFRTIATAMDFTTTYVVVGDLATAAILSAFGFVLGPFVYLGHEMAWDYYGSPKELARDPPMTAALAPAPG
jgi:uncharacterized membrane protein